MKRAVLIFLVVITVQFGGALLLALKMGPGR